MNNKKISLPRTPAEWLEAVMNFIFFLCGILAVGCVLLISVYMVLSGVPAIQEIGLFRFLFGTRWASTAADPAYGILPFILSSVYGTLGATVIGVPIGLLTAVFLSKAADPKLRTVVVTAIELLSGMKVSPSFIAVPEGMAVPSALYKRTTPFAVCSTVKGYSFSTSAKVALKVTSSFPKIYLPEVKSFPFS